MERLKTYLLSTLVVVSILMSYVLAFDQPGFETLQQKKDVETTWMGDTQTTEDVVAPRKVVLHTESKRVYMSYFKQAGYSDIWNKLKEVQLANVMEGPFDANAFQKLREQSVGFECVFDASIPMAALANQLHFPESYTDSGQSVDRIWVYVRAGSNAVRAVFVNEADKAEGMASVALSARELKELVANAAKSAGPSYSWSAYQVYLPDSSLSMTQTTHAFSAATATQLETSLFIEPGAVRKLLDQGGREIYTDGQRGLKIERSSKWMVFNNPIEADNASGDWFGNLNTAVQFVNLHGGWDGTNVLRTVPSSTNPSFGFRQYVNAYPIVSHDAPNRADISITLRNDMVSNYERSIADDDISVVRSTVAVRLPDAPTTKPCCRQPTSSTSTRCMKRHTSPTRPSRTHRNGRLKPRTDNSSY
jgi:regulatory protein YycH of two-component signal transduction system YycFG